MLSSIELLSDDFILKKLESELIDEDSSVEEEEIFLSDKVLVTTYPSDESNSVLFYVYADNYLYPHHEISYPSVFFDCKVIKDNYVAVSSLSNDILVFDSKVKNPNEPTFTFQGHQSSVLCLDYFDGLISGSEDKSIIFWDDNKVKEVIKCNEEITKVSVNDKLIAYLSNHKLVLRSKEEIIKEYTLKEIEDIKLTKENLFFTQGDGILHVVDLRNLDESVFEVHKECINTFDFYKDWIVTGSEDKTIQIFDYKKGGLVKQFKVTDCVTKLKMNDGICFYGGEEIDLNFLNFNYADLAEK